MAIVIPKIDEIKSSKPYPEEGEIALVEMLSRQLDDSYEIYFQSYLNGLHPDIVIMREGYGLLIIEVKDWNLSHYTYEYKSDDWNYGIMRLKENCTMIKTPFEQVTAYKDSIYKLHSYDLAIENLKNKKYYGFVKTGVYFHNETTERVLDFFQCNKECKKDKKYFIQKWGGQDKYEVILAHKIKKIFNRKYDLSKEVYTKLRTLLTPIYHKANEGKELKLTKKELDLIKSEDGLEKKLKGVAGCGKSTILAHKAVNVIRRKGPNSRVLILSYNITLKNYIRDKISAVRADFPWKCFHITYFHGLMIDVANTQNVDIKVDDKIDFSSLKVDQFKNNISKEAKYDAILIDEAQDFEKEWFEILKSSFLKENGEFFIIADEKQNIYDRKLDDEKKVITNIKGAWNSISTSRRLEGKINDLARDFQKKFLKDKYEIDTFNVKQEMFDLDNSHIKYKYIENQLNESTPEDIYSQIFDDVKKIMDFKMIHPNNVAILSNEISHLRKLEDYIVNNYKINCETIFETQKEYDELKDKYKISSTSLENQFENIRRIKKFAFNNNSGKLKICTIHSFKGWEAETLVLIIDGNDEKDENIKPELIYTAITRCKKNLLIYNISVKKYHEFFKNHCDYYVEKNKY